ncbi:hypothetical protein P3T37_000330 [Kitasatospora sp. MAA4]|uniref:CU044_2847 family protein n=1 Tax=Kitasatospora sp. MAA4 TaxID=3035093 RepID=UPI0024752A13|nr:CU044_2847 family protein [Kitasatospora sp. MAA4]MDH6130963.1 hypothetical protein [Kitasatospora sp. MAA4]
MEFTFVDGTAVLVEVAPVVQAIGAAEAHQQLPGDSSVGPVGVTGRVVQQAGQTLREAFAPVVPVLSSLHDQVRRMPQAPDEVSVEFGVKLTAGLKLAVVSGGEASFTISAKWSLASGDSAQLPEVSTVTTS